MPDTRPGPPRRSSGLKGIGFMLTAGVCAVSMHAAIRDLSEAVHPFEIAFFRNVFGFAFLLPMLWRAGGLAAFETRRP